MVDGFRNVDSCIAGKLSLRGYAITKANNWESMLRYVITSRDRGGLASVLLGENIAPANRLRRRLPFYQFYDSKGRPSLGLETRIRYSVEYIQTNLCALSIVMNDPSIWACKPIRTVSSIIFPTVIASI